MFGIDPAVVEGMRKPVLVRVVDKEMDLKEMAVKSRLYNQTTTQKLQEKAEGVSRAKMLSDQSLAIMADALASDPDLTLRKFLDSSASKRLINALLQDGVIQETEISSLTDDSGMLNGSGKDLVENAFRGMIVPNYDILKSLPDSVLNKLDRSIPALARLKNRGEGWDLTPVITPAMRLIGQAKAENRKLDDWLAQVDMFDNNPDKKRPAVQALALTFSKATQKEIAARLNLYAEESGRTQKGAGMLMAGMEEATKPAPAFIRAFLKPVVLVGGKPLANFNPAKNSRHAAIEWASKQGNTVEAAMNAIQKEMGKKSTPQETKEQLRGYMGALADMGGHITRYDANLGSFFSYRKGEELFQDSQLRQKFDAIQPAIVKGDEIFNAENPFPEKMADRRRQVIKWLEANNLFKSYHNTDTGWDISVSKGSVRDTAAHGFDLGKAQIIAVLPKMLETAIHIDKGRNNSRDIFAAKAQIGNDIYLVGIVIDTDTNGHRFYNHEMTEIKKLDAAKLDRLENANVTGQNQALSVLHVIRNKLGVNPDENTILMQGQNKRGSVTIMSDTYLVRLFDDADLSTLVHETGHIFFEEMSKLVQNGLADDAMLADYQIMRKWLGAQDGQELTVEQREQAARGFEAYLMEGKAPTRELKSSFSRFKKWLLAIYRRAVNLNAPLTDEVRGVFDRMLAAESEINRSARDNGPGGLTRQELERLGLDQEGMQNARDLPQTARNKATEALRETRDRNRKSRLRRLMREARAQIGQEQVYITRKAIGQ